MDLRAYGNQGSISRHHNPFNYLRALGKTRRVWEGGSQPWQNDFGAPVWRLSWSVMGNVLAVSDANNAVTVWKESVDGKWDQISATE